MTDEPDYLGFTDPTERRAARGPAFYAPAKVGGHELRVLSLINVDAGRPEFAGHVHAWETTARDGAQLHHDTGRVVFVTVTDERTLEDCAEKWSLGRCPETGKDRDEGERWRKIMRWPVGVVPTPADAMSFMANADARLQAKWWPELQAARLRDERAARGEGEVG